MPSFSALFLLVHSFQYSYSLWLRVCLTAVHLHTFRRAKMGGRADVTEEAHTSGSIDQPRDYLITAYVLRKNPRLADVRRGFCDVHVTSAAETDRPSSLLSSHYDLLLNRSPTQTCLIITTNQSRMFPLLFLRRPLLLLWAKLTFCRDASKHLGYSVSLLRSPFVNYVLDV